MNQASEEHSHIVRAMLDHDPFSRWLGLECIAVRPGYAKLSMTVRNEMLNGFGIAHGGITYSLADTALAFAANATGEKAVSVETSITHTEALREGEVITVEVKEDTSSRRLGVYHAVVSNASGKPVAVFKGVVYKTGKKWDAIIPDTGHPEK